MSRSRIEQEKRVVAQMIALYCRHKEGNGTLCPHCKALLEYAHARLSHCRYGEGKPTCKQCPVHCYSLRMREQIRTVMRYAGPRMLLYHPWSALKHLLIENRKLKIEKDNLE